MPGCLGHVIYSSNVKRQTGGQPFHTSLWDRSLVGAYALILPRAIYIHLKWSVVEIQTHDWLSRSIWYHTICYREGIQRDRKRATCYIAYIWMWSVENVGFERFFLDILIKANALYFLESYIRSYISWTFLTSIGSCHKYKKYIHALVCNLGTYNSVGC